jgi:hypothetical protein
MNRLVDAKISALIARREAMLEPDEVTAMLRLTKLGCGSRRIARELGCPQTQTIRSDARSASTSAMVLGTGSMDPVERTETVRHPDSSRVGPNVSTRPDRP